MRWLLRGLALYVALSLAMGGFAAAIAWDYAPWEAFWVTALTWPLLLAAFFFS